MCNAEARFFLLVDLQDGGGGKEKKSSENDQLTGHFTRVFFRAFFLYLQNKQ